MWDCDVIMQMCWSGLQLSWAWPCIVTTEAATGGPSVLYLALESLVSCTDAIGPPLECTKQKITLKLYSRPELELTVTLQQSSETSKPILLLLYLRINIYIIFRPLIEGVARTGAMSVRRSSERHAHTSQHQHTSHTHHQRSHSARHAR